MDNADELLNKQVAFQAHLEAMYRQSQHEFAERFLHQVHRDLTAVNRPALPMIYKRLLYYSRRWCSKTLLMMAHALDPEQVSPSPVREARVDVVWEADRFDEDKRDWFAIFSGPQEPSP